MTRSGARKLAAILGFALAAMGETTWAQAPEQPLNLTGRILFGYADLSQSPSLSESGPAATLETDFSGYWRDPRILEFDIKPIVTLGQAVQGTEMGNSLTGGSAVGLILQGSPFPLTLTYSRFGSSLGEGYKSGASTNPSQDVLNGVETKTTTSVFDAHWLLRFSHWPVVSLDYRDTDYNSELPQVLGAADDHRLHDFTAQINYNQAGWLFAGRYQHLEYTTTAPDILTGGVQNSNGTTSDLGFTASRMLPLHSTVSVNADQTKSDFSIDGSETNLNARTANVTLTGQPVEKLSTTLQMQYSSNLQASEVQQALAGAGVPGTPPSSAPATTPLTYLAAPYHVLSFNWGAGYRLGHGFSFNGNVGDSYTSPDSGRATQWSAGLAYTRRWRAGWLSTSYSHSQYSTSVEVLNQTSATGTSNTSQGPDTYSLFSENLNLETGAVNLTQNLPSQFRLASSAHVSEGTLHEEGLPYPYHDYGGMATLTRPVGQWTLTGSFSLDEIAANQPSIYNKSKSESASLGAAYRGLSLSGGYQYGSGLALQVGTSLIYITNPQAVSPVLGIPVLSSTSGTNLTGSYRSRRGRLMLYGYWYRFSYTTDHLPTTDFNLFNVHASYKLRRLRLIAGYLRQSQVLGVGPSNVYDSKLMYFQVERVFRLY
jgi:hypothetical protein